MAGEKILILKEGTSEGDSDPVGRVHIAPGKETCGWDKGQREGFWAVVGQSVGPAPGRDAIDAGDFCGKGGKIGSGEPRPNIIILIG